MRGIARNNADLLKSCCNFLLIPSEHAVVCCFNFENLLKRQRKDAEARDIPKEFFALFNGLGES